MKIAISINSISSSGISQYIGDSNVSYIDLKTLKLLRGYNAVPVLITDPNEIHEHDLQGIILPGSDLNDDKKRIEIDAALVELSVQKKIPSLGICRGLQTLNLSLKGTVKKLHDNSIHKKNTNKNRSDLNHSACSIQNSIAYKCFGENMKTNGTHDLQVDKIGEGLTPTLMAEDGGIEALEMMNHPFFIGVQFHPELRADIDPHYRAIFDLFFKQCSYV